MKKKWLTADDVYQIIGSEQIRLILDRICGKSAASELLNEMIAYKNIEKKLGIDLVTLFQALHTGVYDKNSEFYAPRLELVEYGDNKQELMLVEERYDDRPSVWFQLKDYGRTWALTPEELQWPQ